MGRTLPRIVPFSRLDPSYRVTARIDQAACIRCGACYTACEDGCYQAIRRAAAVPQAFSAAGTAAGGYAYQVDEQRCVGCNMCSLICPVPGCITMRPLER